MMPPMAPQPQMTMQQVSATLQEIERILSGVVIDQQLAIHQTLLAVACGGHVLVEDVPGVGKTTLARALAEVLGLSFARIQGTTDLMPAEITGVSIWDERGGAFQFHPGPLMHQCVLFDELNRATPKTQSALLEAMQERQVTVDGVTRPLPAPFIVLATQNPIDYEGTFSLTEAQRDRFFVHVTMGYPSMEGARRLLDLYLAPQQQAATLRHSASLRPAITPEALAALIATRSTVYIDPTVRDYIIALSEATHAHPDVRLGLSPRASLMIGQAAQASAAFGARDFVTPDDVQAVLIPVAAHRLILYSRADLAGTNAAQIMQEIVAKVPTPAWPAGYVPGTNGTNGTNGANGMGRAAPRSQPLPRLMGR